jgi:hypothetical protein
MDAESLPWLEVDRIFIDSSVRNCSSIFIHGVISSSMMSPSSLILLLPYSSSRSFYLAYKRYAREWILERYIRDRCTVLQFYQQSAPRSVKRIIMNRSTGAQTSVGSVQITRFMHSTQTPVVNTKTEQSERRNMCENDHKAVSHKQ